MKIEFSPNGIAIPESWDGVYNYVSACNGKSLKKWKEEYDETGQMPDWSGRQMYILERSDELDYRWHYAGGGASEKPSDRWLPICVIESFSYAEIYIHGFMDAMEAVEVVFWDGKKRIHSEKIEKMVKHLVEMERI